MRRTLKKSTRIGSSLCTMCARFGFNGLKAAISVRSTSDAMEARKSATTMDKLLAEDSEQNGKTGCGAARGNTTDNLKSRSEEKGKIQREGRRVSASGIFSRQCCVKIIACFYRCSTRFIRRLNTEMARRERHGICSKWNSSNARK